MARSPSPQTRQVLAKLLENPSEWIHGYDILAQLELASGTLYPILMRLHDRGILEFRWQDSPLDGRPRRRQYRLTRDGVTMAQAAISHSSTAPQAKPQLGTA